MIRVKYDTTKLCHVILYSYIRIQEGNASSDYHQDSEGKPESAASKAVKGSVKLAAKITKSVVKTGIVDEDIADMISSVADAAENQADASRNATIGDRLMTGGWYIVVAHYNNLYSYLPRCACNDILEHDRVGRTKAAMRVPYCYIIISLSS